MPDSESSITVTAICGSMRESGSTEKALRIALKGAEELGATTKLLLLREYELVFLHAVPEAEYPNDVFRLRNEIEGSQGLIIGTPEYHGSFSGVLKNAIDLMGFKQFQSKMIGLVGVAGGSVGALNSLNALRSIGRQLHAWVIPHQASIPNSSSQFNDDGSMLDKQLENRVKEVGRQVARFAYLHSAKEIQEFVKVWEDSPLNPGGMS